MLVFQHNAANSLWISNNFRNAISIPFSIFNLRILKKPEKKYIFTSKIKNTDMKELRVISKNIELPLKRTPEYDRLAFTVLAIEASAQKMGISPSEMRRRLDKVGLIKSLIQDCYDTLHTESRDAVANDVIEALKSWERKE